ncbi:hypothetical protein QUB60_04620 [Microcoleus sp. A2-C5]|uniref:hypothetical protein n=1 Tax=unclassified Microcoleus TaxID=2642155 RepID=UPI002FD47C18
MKKKEEGRRKKEEGRRKKEEGRRKKERLVKFLRSADFNCQSLMITNFAFNP